MHHEPTYRSQHASERADRLLFRGDSFRARFDLTAHAAPIRRSTGKKPGETHVKSAAREQAAVAGYGPGREPASQSPPKKSSQRRPSSRNRTSDGNHLSSEEMAGESSAGPALQARRIRNAASGGSQAVFESADRTSIQTSARSPHGRQRREFRIIAVRRTRRSRRCLPSRQRRPDLSRRSRPSARVSRFVTSPSGSTARPTSSTRSGAPIAMSCRRRTRR